jgi:hypothetical protein
LAKAAAWNRPQGRALAVSGPTVPSSSFVSLNFFEIFDRFLGFRSELSILGNYFGKLAFEVEKSWSDWTSSLSIPVSI